MKPKLPLNPIFNVQAINTTKMLDVISNQSETCNFGSASYKEVVILNGCPNALRSKLFLAKSINGCGKGNHFYFIQKNVDYAEVFIFSGTFIGSKTLLHNRYICHITMLLTDFLKSLINTVLVTQCKYADIGI